MLIEIIKGTHFHFSDDELDYAFRCRKRGRGAVERDLNRRTKRLGQFADKHKMQVGYRSPAVTPAVEATFAGESTTANPILLLLQATTRRPCPSSVSSASRMCVKDRVLQRPNMPFGQGDADQEVLQLMRPTSGSSGHDSSNIRCHRDRI